MPYKFVTVDVFTDTMFGGNPLAVLPDARGLADDQMQAIAREFNYSETTFVLPAEDENNTRKVRIFTPMSEIPFAGHPNVGTAVALARVDGLGACAPGQRLLFEEGAGVVSVFLRGRNGEVEAAEFIAPVINGFDAEVSVADAAKALGVSPDNVVTANHPPQIMSLGIRFLYVELSDLEALKASEAAQGPVTRISATLGLDGVCAYVRVGEDNGNGADLRVRVYAPVHGVMEDPATGSANAGLANILGSLSGETNATLKWNVVQGVEMGRPSKLRLTAEMRDGKVAEIRVAGGAVIACTGEIQVP